MNSLKTDWLNHCAAYSSDEALSTSLIDELITLYQEPHRRYHNLDHISHMLSDLHTLTDGNIPAELFFAAWYHDSIYDTLRHDNEQASADLASAKLQLLHLPESVIPQVVEAILHTADHFRIDAEEDDLIKIFLDTDIKILGADPETYRKYVSDIREEYKIFPDELFYAGRKLFIERTLSAQHIFRTKKYRQQYETQARINLSNELNLYK